jgi:hypothetical protein
MNIRHVFCLTGIAVIVLSSLLAACQGGIPAAPVAAPTTVPVAPPAASPVAAAIDGAIVPGEYTASRTYGDYQVSWRTEGTNIVIAIRARTQGWVSFGIGAGMNNSDLILCSLKDDRAAVTDQYGQNLNHREDTALGGANDLSVFAGSRKDGYTTFEFRRALNTGDKYDIALAKGVNPIVWSYGAVDDTSQKHVNRGRGEIVIE